MIPITNCNHTIKDIIMFNVSIVVGSFEVHVFVWIILLKIASSFKYFNLNIFVKKNKLFLSISK